MAATPLPPTIPVPVDLFEGGLARRGLDGGAVEGLAAAPSALGRPIFVRLAHRFDKSLVEHPGRVIRVESHGPAADPDLQNIAIMPAFFQPDPDPHDDIPDEDRGASDRESDPQVPLREPEFVDRGPDHRRALSP